MAFCAASAACPSLTQTYCMVEADGFVAQALPHQREVDVGRDQVAGEGVLEHMGMPLLRRQPGCLGAGPEDAEKLCAVEPAALLRREQVIGAVSSPLPAPGTQGAYFVEQRLPSV